MIFGAIFVVVCSVTIVHVVVFDSIDDFERYERQQRRNQYINQKRNSQ